MRKYFILGLLTAGCLLAAPGEVADAAERGQWARVRSLLAAKEDAKAAQTDGMTALHWAVQANQAEIVTALLAAGVDPNAANRNGITPLWLAATNGSAAMVRTLVKAGASAAAKLPHGENALMTAARTGEPETIKALLELGADPNASETSTGETGLMWAAAENHPEAIGVLIAGGADPNRHAKALDIPPMDWKQVGMVSTVLPSGGFTALMYAARQDAQDAVRALAESGADLNAQDPDGATALQLAIINQHYDLAAILVEKGANPNVADRTGMTAIFAAVDMIGFRSEIGRPVFLRQDQRSAMDVLQLMLEHGGNPNLQQIKPAIERHHGLPDNSLGAGATPLMRAAKSMDMPAMEALLKAGADPKLGMANGSNPLLLVVANRVGNGPGAFPEDQIAKAIRMMAERGANLNAANARGEPALHIVARQGYNVLVQTLADLGADLDVKDRSGKTALEIVMQPGTTRHEDTETLLRQLAAGRNK